MSVVQLGCKVIKINVEVVVSLVNSIQLVLNARKPL